MYGVQLKSIIFIGEKNIETIYKIVFGNNEENNNTETMLINNTTLEYNRNESNVYTKWIHYKITIVNQWTQKKNNNGEIHLVSCSTSTTHRKT